MEVQRFLLHAWPQSCQSPVPSLVPFTGNEGDRELQNSGSEARRCCRAGEEEKPWLGHSRGEAPECSRSWDRHRPLARCHQGLLQKSSAGTFWVLPAQSWALPAQTSLVEQRCGLGKGMSWLCPPCFQEAPDGSRGCPGCAGIRAWMSCVGSITSSVVIGAQRMERLFPALSPSVVLVFVGSCLSPDLSGTLAEGQVFFGDAK